MRSRDDTFDTLVFGRTFFASFMDKRFSVADRKRFLTALRLLDGNEQHPSLRVHQLQGDLAGIWSACASEELRMTFRRLDEGRKWMLTCRRHYQ